MTILPLKKKRERDTSQRPPGAVSNSDLRASALRRLRKSPRANEKLGPPIKRGLLSSPQNHSSKIGSPLASPRSDKSHDNHSSHLAQSSHNSDDEYEQEMPCNELEKEFVERFAARGLTIKEMVGDGACMFRAIAEQIYGDQEMHGQIRKLCMDYMAKNRDYFGDFITEDFDQYIRRKRCDTVHGNHLELQAISELFARPVEVYEYSTEPISILLPRGSNEQASSSSRQQNPPLRLSYHGSVHYNAIIDPQHATIGVGLGLPGLIPRGDDIAVMENAIEVSEREHIEETMLKDKIDMTDWQRTQEDLVDQISRESYLAYVRETEKNSAPPKPEAEKPENLPPTATPTVEEPSTSNEAPSAGLYEELLAAHIWEPYNEEMAMAEALLLSRQEFIENNKTGSSSGASSQ
ncbi:unnamed protein product [Caenorhabditis bovis]|uniref:ubiquitinyl hydrolase 1 n=1 Tax=Caenorhabditis bovis TaxID=2654633 RepID=A0A8S1F5R1_9PELO|nr:unnamed protein product [Caenorhabditis bovis]